MRAAGLAHQLVELVSGLFLKVQKLKRQFFALQAARHEAPASTVPYGTGRCF